MTSIKKILKTIDTSKMETKWVDIYEMCTSEFNIHEYLEQPKDNKRLTYCYYHRWICTDTEVGIKVWFFDNWPVCISWKPYRKSNETFGWLSKEGFEKVWNYANSLKQKDFDITIIDDETIGDVVDKFNNIDYKKFEALNITE